MEVSRRLKDYFSKADPRALKLVEGIEIFSIPDEIEECVAHDGARILSGSGLETLDCLTRLEAMGLEHFIQEGRRDYFYEVLSSCIMMRRPTQFIRGKRPFLLYEFQPQKNLKLSVFRKSFKNTTEKNLIMKALDEFLFSESKLSRFRDRLLQVSDELMLNALYIAPVNKSGVRVFQNTSRRDFVEYYTNSNPAMFFLYSNDKKVLVGCQDPFGSLNIKELLKSLIDAYTGQKEVTRRKSGAGGGIGLRFVLDYAPGFYAASQSGVSSTVACSFELDMKLSEIESLGRHIHLCEIK